VKNSKIKKTLNSPNKKINLSLFLIKKFMKQIISFSVCLALTFFFCSAALNAQPTITSFTPTSGSIGTTVTITGTNFSTTAANNIVYFGATKATVSSATATELEVAVPVSTTYKPITVLNTETGLLGASAKSFHVIYSNGSISASPATMATKVDLTSGDNPAVVAIGDIDGNGKSDIVVANRMSSNISVFRNISTSGTITTGSFATRVNFTSGSQPRGVALGDLDGDGKLDVVVTNMNNSNISVFRNISSSGSISFATLETFASPLNCEAVSIGDIDGDGRMDVILTNTGGNTISIYRNTGTSPGSISFAARVDFATGAGPHGVAIEDIDGDGKIDVVTANRWVSNVSVLRNTSTAGTISFATKVDFTIDGQPLGVSIGDMDGDGKPDIVTSNYHGSFLIMSVLRNTSTAGSVSMAAKVDFPTGTNSWGISVGDMDGDGKLDVVVANSGSNTISILKNTSSIGSVSMNPKVDFATGASPSMGLAIGDLDGDSKSDVVVGNFGSNTLSVFRTVTGWPLPVSWQSFTASKQGNNVSLNWATASEQNSKDFTIQHSTNSSNWTNQATIAAAGNSNSIKNYSYLHHTAQKGNNYYRILQKDLDGKFSYSQIRKVNMKTNTNVVSIQNNPVINGVLQLQLSESTKLSLYNSVGAIVWEKQFSAGTQSVDVSGLAKGIYLLGSVTETIQVVVK
jgi:hypothetical protein